MYTVVLSFDRPRLYAFTLVFSSVCVRSESSDFFVRKKTNDRYITYSHLVGMVITAWMRAYGFLSVVGSIRIAHIGTKPT